MLSGTRSFASNLHRCHHPHSYTLCMRMGPAGGCRTDFMNHSSEAIGTPVSVFVPEQSCGGSLPSSSVGAARKPQDAYPQTTTSTGVVFNAFKLVHWRFGSRWAASDNYYNMPSPIWYMGCSNFKDICSRMDRSSKYLNQVRFQWIFLFPLLRIPDALLFIAQKLQAGKVLVHQKNKT